MSFDYDSDLDTDNLPIPEGTAFIGPCNELYFLLWENISYVDGDGNVLEGVIVISQDNQIITIDVDHWNKFYTDGEHTRQDLFD